MVLKAFTVCYQPACQRFDHAPWVDLPTVRRILFYSFFDADGIVDDHVLHHLRALREHTSRIVVVAGEPLDEVARSALSEASDLLIIGPEQGEASDGHGTWLAALGPEELSGLAGFDEALLVDSSFFGPIFPYAEVLDRMAETTSDFWGMTSRRNSDGQSRLSASWVALPPQLMSLAFDTTPWPLAVDSLIESMEASGHTWEAAFPHDSYPTDDPSFESPHLLLADRCPVLDRRILEVDPAVVDRLAIPGRRLLEELERSEYPLNLVWSGIVRSAEPRHVYTNFSLLEVLAGSESSGPPASTPRIAVCLHVYYDDMIPELMDYVSNIPGPYHVDITTDTQDKRQSILTLLEPYGLDDVTVRVVASNQGRDTSALLIAQRDVLLSGDYDLICRIHSKKSPQDSFNVSDLFRNHLYENLLPNRGYVSEVLRLFDEHPTLGMVFPPVINIGYPTLGHAWFANRAPAEALAKRLGLRTRFDTNTPLAPFGSMFWARPEALRKLVEADWSWTDFPEDGEYRDGSLTHVLERLLAYTVLDAGFHVRSVINREWGGVNYAFLEYKLQRIASFLPGQTEEQVAFLSQPPVETPPLAAVKVGLHRRFPAIGQRLRPAYHAARAVYRRAKGR